MEQQNNKKPELHIMIDLETSSNEPDAGIFSMALVPFSIDEEKLPTDEIFYRVIDLASCYMAGMNMVGCQEWWVEQDPKAKAVILNAEKKVSIQSASADAFGFLSAWAENYDLIMWCRGLDYDIPKLEYCFRRFVERPFPYKYSHKRDVRTCLRDFDIQEDDFEFEGVKHHSVDDCRHDIQMVQAAYKKRKMMIMLYYKSYDREV